MSTTPVKPADGGGPPDKWVWMRIDDASGAEIGSWLNAIAAEGFYEQTVVAEAKDGTYLYAGNYKT